MNLKKKYFYDALNFLDFRNDLAKMFNFPSSAEIKDDEDIDEFIKELEKDVREKNLSLVRLKHEKQLAETLLKRCDARHDKLQSKATTLLGFFAAIFTFLLGVFVPFHDRIGVAKISFLIELAAIILIGIAIASLINISKPKPTYEFKNLYVNENQDEKIDIDEKNEEPSLYHKEIASYWIAIGIRDYSNNLIGKTIIRWTNVVGWALLLLFIDLILRNVDFIQKLFSCFYCAFAYST